MVKKQLIDFICRNFMVEPDEINMNESLINQGIIDSFGLVEISSFIKSSFKFTVPQKDMTRENFGSVNKLVTYIEGRL